MTHADGFRVATRDNIHQTLIGAIVGALENCTSLTTDQDLILLVEKVANRIGQRPPHQQHGSMGAKFFGLARYCETMPDGIIYLSEAVEELEQGSMPSLMIQQIALEWEALDAQPALVPRWGWLCDLLGRVGPSELQWLLRRTPDALFPDLPRFCTTPWSAFLFLLGSAAAPDTVPLWMIFLDRLRDRLDKESAEELWAQNRQWAVPWGLGGELDQARYRPHPVASTSGNTGYIVIQLSPISIDSGQYTLSYWLQKDAHRWQPEPGLNRDLELSDLALRVAEVISEAEASWGDRPGHLNIEFVLPMELINLPVEWLPKDPLSQSSVPLAVMYPVVLRSFERLGRREWHRRWRLRWDRLNAMAASSKAFPSTPAGDGYLTQLEIMLSTDENHPGVVLSQPPEPGRNGGPELEMALRIGCPIVIWNRTADGAEPGFRSAVDRLQRGGVRHLRDRLAEQRREVAVLSPRDRERHPGYHIAVLWDDPDRKPWSA